MTNGLGEIYAPSLSLKVIKEVKSRIEVYDYYRKFSSTTGITSSPGLVIF
ncbi:hypothetical protein Smp_158470 [Schistosoma mansoni]|uniref:Uncharacterized protein n=1 Tax=Schistosoma mansoni TaxID=6183 RepID=G4V6R6_SCHMA|nr:hypothetical protein Smp_158470 [Schistosoma mansoni]|eukprot:XP_018648699.1 hypothetical protein Smp_158470 [Schistosoma mansoni]